MQILIILLQLILFSCTSATVKVGSINPLPPVVIDTSLSRLSLDANSNEDYRLIGTCDQASSWLILSQDRWATDNIKKNDYPGVALDDVDCSDGSFILSLDRSNFLGKSIYINQIFKSGLAEAVLVELKSEESLSADMDKSAVVLEVSVSSVKISWDQMTHDSTSLEDFTYAVYMSSRQVPVEEILDSSIKVSTDLAGQSSYTVIDLAPDTVYFFYVIASDIKGNQYFYPELMARTGTPPPPFERVSSVYIANDVMSIAIYNGKLYAGTWGRTIETIDLNTFTFDTQYTPADPGGNWFKGSYIDATSDRAFFVADNWPTKIVKYNASTMAYITTFDLPNEVGKREGTTLVGHNGFLYTAGSEWITSADSSTHSIMKVDMNDGTTTALTGLLVGESYFHSMVIDYTDEMLYAVTGGDPAQVIKVDLTNFTKVGTIALNAGESNFHDGCFIDQTNRDLVCGAKQAPAVVVRVDLTTFTRKDALTLSEDNITCAVYNDATKKAYFGLNQDPAKVIKVDMTSFSEESVTPAFETNEASTDACALDPDTGYVYVGVMGESSGVIKVNP